ncbi:MAG: hypothetical protein WB680_22630, partial [Candidatus Acidiferrales bacterium]
PLITAVCYNAALMIETGIAVAGMIVCWLLGVVIYQDEMSFKRYVIIAILAAAATYFAVRFIHWSWVTPLPFVRSVQ